MAKKKMNFEDALLRLREITEILEQGNVSLDESLKLFSEGSTLSAFCYAALQEAEQKITELTLPAEKEEA